MTQGRANGTLHCSAHGLKYVGMLMFTAEGPRSVDERDVLYVYRGDTVGRYVQVTAVFANGKEVTGLMLVEAVRKLEAKLRDAA